MAKSISTLEAVKPVNALGNYCSEGQEALLKVIENTLIQICQAMNVIQVNKKEYIIYSE